MHRPTVARSTHAGTPRDGLASGLGGWAHQNEGSTLDGLVLQFGVDPRRSTWRTLVIGDIGAVIATVHEPAGRVVVSSRAGLLLVLAAADLLFIVVVLVYQFGSDVDAFSVGLFAYNLLPPMALAVLVIATAGLWPRGMPVTAVTCVLFSGLLVAAMLDMGSSSTGSLLLLFLPIEFCVAVVPFAGLGILVHWLRGRTPRRPGHAGA